jgi:Ca2+-binding RTX toxin-like protein
VRPGPLLTIVGGTIVGVLVDAAPASASFIDIAGHDSGLQIQVSGGPGEANDIEITRMGTTYVITDSAGTTAGPGCSGGGTTVTCPDPTGSIVRVVANSADGDDILVLAAALPGFLIGGPGADRVTGGPARDRLVGVGDADVLIGADGPDRLYGGNQGDTLIGGSGQDRLFGEQGSDRFRAKDGDRDVVDGGASKDKARADRKDRIRNVERVVL